MLIKNRLHISTLFSVVTVFLIGFAIFVASHKANKAHEYEIKANEIVQDVFQLTFLSNDYLLYSTKRSQIQRQLKHNSLSKLLSKLEPQEPERKNILKDIKELNEDIGSLFSRLKSRHARPGFNISNKVDKQAQNRLMNQIFIKSQEMVSYGFQLERESHNEISAIRKMNDLLIMILVIVLATITAIASFFIGRSIIKPIDKLREETELIGVGNLKYSVGTEAKDEVGQLSRDFDRMIGNLKKVMASRDELDKEIMERKKAVSGMILLFVFWNESLTKQVKERTDDLKRSNESLEAEISERKTAEDELKRSRDYLKNLTDSMGDAVLSVGMRERKIEWANDSSFNILGYDPEELIGRTTEFLYPNRNEFLAFGDKLTGAVAEGKDIVYIEQVLRRKSGEAFPVEITVTIHKEKGEAVSVTGIIRDITERKRAEQTLQAYQQRLKALASQLTIAEEKERRRIAADLHDHVGQSLALARMQIAAACKSASDAVLTTKLADISKTLLQALQNTRHLIFKLSSPSMHEIGLRAAISEWLEEEIEKRYDLKTKFIDNIDESHRKLLDENVRAILFRNVRELLTNVVKHAQASQVSVLMEHANAFLNIVIQDDGVGFDYGSKSQTGKSEGGFGLFSIYERMADLGGALEIESEPGKGCTVILRMPLDSLERKRDRGNWVDSLVVKESNAVYGKE